MVEKRVYQVWKGSNNFFLSGRLIFGPDVKSFFVTILLITVPAALFCIFVARDLINRASNPGGGIAVLVVAVLLTIHVLILLFLTSSRDPGIIPRAPHPPEPEDYESAASPASWGGGQTPRWRLPRTRDVTVNGITVKVKYCDTCMLYRPPRCSHCSVCDNCVERFDHHCPWVGQCIGKRNYRYFFMFVSSATILCLYVLGISIWYMVLLKHGRSFWQAISKSPVSIILMVYSFIAVWFVGGLTVFHLYLIATNQTTYENFRYRYESRVNPHNLGIIRNFISIFCTPIEPSKNNFRAKVQLDTSQGVVNPLSTAQKDEEIEIATKSSLEPGQADANDGDARISAVSDLGMEAKDTFDEALAHAMGRPLPPQEDSERTSSHRRRSSWGRRSGNWEMTPEILALATGKSQDLESTSANVSVSTRPSNEITGP